jgi:hypothetical protein
LHDVSPSEDNLVVHNVVADKATIIGEVR